MYQYEFEKTLGEGAFGQVRQAIHKETGEKVAIKTLKDKCPNFETMMRMPEIQALSNLSHDNIVKCKEFLLDSKGYAHIIFELVQHGNLEALARKRTKPFSESQIRSVFYQLLQAISYMHSKHIMHRDVKPENILVESISTNGDIKVKLADLGLAKITKPSNHRPHTTYVATRWYRSPEILLRITSYSFPSDLWAIGAVMAELVCLGDPLFPGRDEKDQLARVMALRGHPAMVGWSKGERAMRKRRVVLPRTTPTSLRNEIPLASLPVLQLICDLLEMDPERRPTALEALQYPLFTSHQFVNEGYQQKMQKVTEAPLRDAIQTRDFSSSRWSNDSDEVIVWKRRDGGNKLKLQADYNEDGANCEKLNNGNEGCMSLRLKSSEANRSIGAPTKLFDIPKFPCGCDDHSHDGHKRAPKLRRRNAEMLHLGARR